MGTGEAIKKYINGPTQTMQLATVDGDQPWICSVYFVADDDLGLYWLSLPASRHSQEIAKHPKVAAAIAIKQDQPVIGIQIEGDVTEVTNTDAVAKIMKDYVAKYGLGKDFYNNFTLGKNQHKMYRLQPRLFGLFDELNSKGRGRIEWRP